MDENGNIYVAPEDRVPDADRERMERHFAEVAAKTREDLIAQRERLLASRRAAKARTERLVFDGKD